MLKYLMARSKDLDNIAPDNLVIFKSEEEIINKPIEEKKEEIFQNKEAQKPCSKKEFPNDFYDILGHTKSPFSPFLVHPKVFTFIERDDDEEIYLAVRSNPIVNISWILTSIVMILVPFFFKYLTFLQLLPVRYQFAVILFWYLITFIYVFQQFLYWYFDIFIVTNQRVVDIRFSNLLNKHFAEANLAMIQDVSFSVRGVFGTFFNFGDVLIQTASKINQITFRKVPNPKKIIMLLKDLRDLEEEKDNKGDKNNE